MMWVQVRARMRSAWGWLFTVGAELLVALAGPFVALWCVSGEVADGVSEFLVGGPSEGDGAVFAGGTGGGCDSGEAGEGFGFGRRRQAAVPGQPPSNRLRVASRKRE
jgi:hypothetical protein